jgi:hypothetical protein
VIFEVILDVSKRKNICHCLEGTENHPADTQICLPYQTQFERFQTHLLCLLNVDFGRIRVLIPEVKDRLMLTVE